MEREIGDIKTKRVGGVKRRKTVVYFRHRMQEECLFQNYKA